MSGQGQKAKAKANGSRSGTAAKKMLGLTILLTKRTGLTSHLTMRRRPCQSLNLQSFQHQVLHTAVALQVYNQ